MKEQAPEVVTKSGLMLGLGETTEELLEVLADLRAVSCDTLTLGQYLAPTLKHVPVARFVPPAEFDALAVLARVFPGRKVVGVRTRVIAYGGGGVHCITQQVPAARATA